MDHSREAEAGRRAGGPEARAGQDRFAAAFNSAGVMMLIVRAGDGTIVDVNRAFLADTGYERDEVIGRTSQAIGLFADPPIGALIGQGLREHGRGRRGLVARRGPAWPPAAAPARRLPEPLARDGVR